MEKIKSFTIDHDNHDKGFYQSGTNKNIVTYDLRFKTPNGNDYLRNPAMHTIEHLFATVIRNSDIKDNVIYFGPMGCRTGFYLLLESIDKVTALQETIKAFEMCLLLNEVPGSSRKECGNYLEHDILDAKREITEYLKILKSN